MGPRREGSSRNEATVHEEMRDQGIPGRTQSPEGLQGQRGARLIPGNRRAGKRPWVPVGEARGLVSDLGEGEEGTERQASPGPDGLLGEGTVVPPPAEGTLGGEVGLRDTLCSSECKKYDRLGTSGRGTLGQGLGRWPQDPWSGGSLMCVSREGSRQGGPGERSPFTGGQQWRTQGHREA